MTLNKLFLILLSFVLCADSASVAKGLLADADIGPGVMNLLAMRFPKIFLDEVQDTGWFLSRAVLRICSVNSDPVSTQEPHFAGFHMPDRQHADLLFPHRQNRI